MLSQDSLKLIRSNGVLYGQVATEIKVAPASLKRILQENKDSRLRSERVASLVRAAAKEKAKYYSNLKVFAQ